MKVVWAGLILGWALIFFGSGEVHAASTWDIARCDSASFRSVSWCSSYLQAVKITDETEPQEICMFGGDVFEFGTYSSGGFRLVAKHFLDPTFRPVSGVCEGAVVCTYVSSADILVVRYPGSGVIVYRDCFRRLGNVLVNGYQFDVSKPDYQLFDVVGSLAVSENGAWMAVEIKNKGVDLINLQTGQRGRVINQGVLYGFGRDPVEELAVSNDGKYVAQMGDDAGFLVVEVTPECFIGPQSCPSISPNATDLTSAFYFAAHPVFDDGSGRLNFYVATHGQGSRRVTLQRPGYHVPDLTYLALGDSFTSGEGEIDDREYKGGTNDSFEKCHQSLRSYPVLVGMYAGIPPPGFQSVACAGAKIMDMVGESAKYQGQTGRLGVRGFGLSKFEMSSAQSEALDTFQPGRVLQGQFVERYTPKVVTIGVGGNDAGFIGKLKTCAMPDVCEWAADPVYRHATGLEIQRLFDQLKNLYARLAEESPSTVFYAVGYPEIIEPNGICGPITTTLLTFAERVFMQEGIKYLNQVIKSAARESGVTYLDVESAFAGHRLCELSIDPAVNGLRTGDDVSVLSALPMLKVIGDESFHPTPSGHMRVAQAIDAQQHDLLSPGPCIECGVNDDPPPLPPYWNPESAQQYAMFNREDMAQDQVTLDNPTISLNLPAKTFEPDSELRIEVHSDTEQVFIVQVGGDGSLSAFVNVQPGLIEGFHTAHIRNFVQRCVGRSLQGYFVWWNHG